LPQSADPRVLVGFGTSDDAGVFRVRDDLALVQTVDFFTPIVDDPYDFGRIAAANSLSDCYAMGGTPVTALNIAAFPTDTLPLEVFAQILAGGASVAREAGVVILGGHTVRDEEPKYGMAVTGTIDPARIVTNAAARAGDVLVLTKPIGAGILTTALKRGRIDATQLAPVVEVMARLNRNAAAAMLDAGVRSATDITGFGLLGHAGEMARASGVALNIDASAVPLFEGALTLAAEGIVPGGTRDNAEEHARFTVFDPAVSPEHRILLSDAMTSGGLLIAVDPSSVERLRTGLEAGGDLCAIIGSVLVGENIRVEP